MFENLIVLPAIAVGAYVGVTYLIDPNTIIIQQLNVPVQLEERGYNEHVVSRKFSNAIGRITENAYRRGVHTIHDEGAEARQVESLSDWFDLAQPIRATQVALGMLPYAFSGEITQTGRALALHIDGDSPAYWHYSMSVQNNKGDIEQLLKDGAMQLLEDLHPFLVAAYQFHKDEKTGDFAKTREALAHSLVYGPRYSVPWSYLLWARVLQIEGDVDGAVVKFRQALKIDPEFSRAYVRWGDLLSEQGNHTGAIGKYREALAVESTYPEALIRWGWALEGMGRIEEANAKFLEGISLDPDFPTALNSYGKFLLEHGDPQEAADILRRAVEYDKHQSKVFVDDLIKAQSRVEPLYNTLDPDVDKVPLD